MRVIHGATGESLGVMRTDEALRRARAEGLDLIEVAAQAQPPVCRILDFGKFRYELAKQEKAKKKTVTRVKEVKFHANIDEHDYLTKIRHAEEFLDKGNKVKMVLQFRGREMQHKGLGMDLMNRVCQDLATMAHVDMQPKITGRLINMMLSPLAAEKRKRRFSKLGEVELPTDEETEVTEDFADEEYEGELEGAQE